jgi:hypothetical protein
MVCRWQSPGQARQRGRRLVLGTRGGFDEVRENPAALPGIVGGNQARPSERVGVATAPEDGERAPDRHRKQDELALLPEDALEDVGDAARLRVPLFTRWS